MSNNTSSSLQISVFNVTIPVILPVTKTEMIVWLTMQITIALTGALLIIFYLFAMHRLRKLTTGSGLLVAHALIIDLIFCLGGVPVIAIPVYLTQMQVHFEYSCMPVDFFLLFIMIAGNWTAVVLSINRWLAVVTPHHYARIATRRMSFLTLLFVWSVALGCSIPFLNTIPGMVHGILPSGICGLIRQSGPTTMILVVFGTYLPLVLMAIVYSSLFIYTRMQNKFNKIENQANEERPFRAFERRLRIAKALCLSFIWYCLCILPPPILTVFFASWWVKDIRMTLYTKTAQVLAYAASPVFFFAVGTEYRAVVKKGARDFLRSVRNVSSIHPSIQGSASA
ncbi:rhodopsin-like [Paramacrobiotus metropolitanus]|uniref:rhodopsin-like n=1 Tax=Paramacrobiotus metropolitanus TaxID=2943436 RepID=UPI00244613B0|nr:rhodopsin-like [Paramacrobiotus metropolitanus]